MWWIVFMAFLSGIAVGYVIALVAVDGYADIADRQRATRDAVRGVPERDAPQPGARGTAVVHDAEYRERDPEHGMEM